MLSPSRTYKGKKSPFSSYRFPCFPAIYALIMQDAAQEKYKLRRFVKNDVAENDMGVCCFDAKDTAWPYAWGGDCVIDTGLVELFKRIGNWTSP